MAMYVVEIINSNTNTRLGVFSYQGDRINDINELINECRDDAKEYSDEDFEENFLNNLNERGFTDLELVDTFFY
jgi:hypothetical protein